MDVVSLLGFSRPVVTEVVLGHCLGLRAAEADGRNGWNMTRV